VAWLRLEDTFCDHPKFRKLARRLDISEVTARGHAATLWAWTLRHSPDGNLSTYDNEDISIAAGWEGDPELFVASLVECRLLEELDDGVAIHEWMDRAENLKSAQRVRRHRERKRLESNVTVTQRNVTKPKCNGGEERRGEDGEEKRGRRGENTSVELVKPDRTSSTEITAVVDHYRTYHPRARPGAKERKLIASRLKEKYTVSDLKQAIDGCHLSPHHCGQNDRGTKYQSLELIVRDSSKVAQFIEHARGSPVRAEPKALRIAREHEERKRAAANIVDANLSENDETPSRVSGHENAGELGALDCTMGGQTQILLA
jgi:hypothetical protein